MQHVLKLWEINRKFYPENLEESDHLTRAEGSGEYYRTTLWQCKLSRLDQGKDKW
jgi:hypothetical protein